MKKYFFPILCVTAGLAFLPACISKREKEINKCEAQLKKCNKSIEKDSKALQREKAKLKSCAKELYDDVAQDDEVCEKHTEWCGCEKK